MYRRKNKGWLKHLDFIILDLLCLQVCFALAYFSRHGFGGNPHKVIYQNMMLVLVLFEFIYAFFLEGYKDILKRGHYVEFVSVVKQVCILELFISFYHVLPTNGTAKFFSPLGVDDFIKKSSIISYSREALEPVYKDIVQFAECEKLTAHANSIRVRFED